MNDFIDQLPIYKKYPQEEIFGDLMLQYDLTQAKNECVLIPFQIIEWMGNSVKFETWNEENTKVQILMSGEIIFEGVRHCYFQEEENGYMYYPSLKELSLCLDRVHELCVQYCTEYL